MYPTIHYELMIARAADFHRQAERDRIARAAVQARRARHHGRHPAVRMRRICLATGAIARLVGVVSAAARREETNLTVAGEATGAVIRLGRRLNGVMPASRAAPRPGG